MSRSVNSLSKLARIRKNDFNSAFAGGMRYVAVPATGIPSAIRWSFLLFTATLPFEGEDLTLMAGTLSPAKISGYVFFVFYLLYHMPFFSQRSLPRPPQAMWWFLGYLVVYAFNGLLLPGEFIGSFLTFFFTAVQLLFFFWISADLLKDEKMARRVLLIFSFASVVLAVGIILRLPGFSVEAHFGRLTAFGDNPNKIGGLMALAAVIVIGLSLNSHFSQLNRKLMSALLVAPVLVAMVNSGSRAALAAFIVGCAVYLLPYWRSRRAFISIILVVAGVVAVLYAVANNPDALERWQRTYYEGHLANREILFSVAMEMILERPVFGWQPIEFRHELGYRSGFGWRESDAHNLFLHLLLEVGIVGAIPFFIGIGLCGWGAWRARDGSLGLLPLALFLTLMAVNMSGTGLKTKSLWLFFALAVAAGSSLSRAGRRRVLLLRQPSIEKV